MLNVETNGLRPLEEVLTEVAVIFRNASKILSHPRLTSGQEALSVYAMSRAVNELSIYGDSAELDSYTRQFKAYEARLTLVYN